MACLGGDGTLNEVINGLAGTGVPLATIPGGGTNVFARTLGYPEDPIEATSVLLGKLRDGVRPTTVGLGRVNGRAFGFCAGVGFDAAVVRAVERRFRLKKTIGESFFVTTALRLFFFGYDRARPILELKLPDGVTYPGLYVAIVGNSNPYTFLGERRFQLTPLADFERGLDVTALTSMATARVLRLVFRAFGSGRHIDLKYVRALHDLEAFEIHATRPVPWQVDGDYLGEESVFRFTSEPDALGVIA